MEFIPNESHRLYLKSLLNVAFGNLQRFYNEGDYNLQPVRGILNDWINKSRNLSETTRTCLKSLLDISFHSVRVFADGKPLDPVSHV